jgi:hypothetical protein
MSAWKQFLASDFIVVPFQVNKGFTFNTSSFYTQSNGEFVGIERFLGVNTPWDVIYTANNTTGVNQVEYQSLIYNSAKQLYYSNFLYSSSGDQANLRVLIPGSGPSGSGDTFIGSGISGSNPLYDNFLQSTLTPQRYWPSASGDSIAVISIPSKIYGEYVAPLSFIFEYSSSFKAYDDGEGNLYSSASFSWDTGELEYFYYSESLDWTSYTDPQEMKWASPSNLPAGYTFISASWQGAAGRTPFIDANTTDPVQEIDNQGITYDESTGVMQSDSSVWAFQDTTGDTGPALFTWVSSSALIKSVDANENVGNIIYPHGMAIFTNQDLPISSIVNLGNVICSFSSSYTIYETQYKCTIREDEFNYTLNPSAQASGSTFEWTGSYFYEPGNGQLSDNLTGSYFSPYVTTVGLYNEAQDLIAVGKLAQPLPTSNTTDLTILVNLDV